MVQARFRKSRLGRLASLGGLAARLAGSTVVGTARRVTAGRDAAMELMHTKAAGQLLDTLGGMKGLPMKVGQILSFMDGLVPAQYQPIYAAALARLQIRSKPLPWEDMLKVLEAELGRPYGEVFASLDPEPLAAASIGQVYSGILHDGRPIAVKIQYPGIAQAVKSDLKNVGALVSTINAILPGDGNKKLTGDFMSRIAEECDYVREAANQQAFAERWAGDPQISVPAIVPELCSQRVLVSELAAGETFAELVASDDAERKSAVGRSLFRFIFRSVLQDGLFNADPHPGNYLFPGGDRVVCLDFGCVQRFDAEARAAFRDLVEAMLEGRRGADLWEVAARGMGFPADTPESLRAMTEEYLLFCFEPAIATQPYRYTRDYTTRVSELTVKLKLQLAKSVLRRGWREPKRDGLILLGRILFGANSLFAALGAEHDWRAQLLDLARRDEVQPVA